MKVSSKGMITYVQNPRVCVPLLLGASENLCTNIMKASSQGEEGHHATTYTR
jgi:hypothetical protein